MITVAQEHRDSGSLKNFLLQQTTSLDSDPEHIYVHVKNVMDRMKLYRKEVYLMNNCGRRLKFNLSRSVEILSQLARCPITPVPL